MATVKELLNKIKTAVYGRDVRSSIHDAISQCYDDATGNPNSVARLANEVSNLKENTNQLIQAQSKRIDQLVTGAGVEVQEGTITLSKSDVDFAYNNWSESVSPAGPTVTLSYDFPEAFSALPQMSMKLITENVASPDVSFSSISETHYIIQLVLKSQTALEFKWRAVAIGDDVSPDAELADIRVGVDGTSYDSAGAAVRAQINEVISRSKWTRSTESMDLSGSDLAMLTLNDADYTELYVDVCAPFSSGDTVDLGIQLNGSSGSLVSIGPEACDSAGEAHLSLYLQRIDGIWRRADAQGYIGYLPESGNGMGSVKSQFGAKPAVQLSSVKKVTVSTNSPFTFYDGATIEIYYRK